MRRWILAAAIAALPGLPADAAPGGPLRLSARRGPADDPGVVVIRGRRADGIARVWFGAEEAPAVAPWQGDGISVAVPPGPSGSRIPVLAEMADGDLRRVGGFAYEGTIPRGRSVARLSGREGCVAGSGALARFRGATTSSSVRRLPDRRFLYRWEFRNSLAGAVTVRWVTLEHLGFTGGLAFNLAPGERFRLARESDAPPVLVRGIATASAFPGCPDLDPEGDGESWDSGAFLAADEVPAVAPVEGVAAVPVSSLDHEVSWQAGAGDAPDSYEVIARGLLTPILLRAGPNAVDHEVRRRAVAAPGGSVVLDLRKGVNTVSIRALRDGVPSEPVVLTVVR